MRPNEYDELVKKIKCSDDFRRRMQEKLSAEPVDAAEYEDVVSGTEVITAKHRWGKFAAMAAAFVLVCGAVGGGAYHFANMPDNDKSITDDEQENVSIYSKLKAQKDKLIGDIILKSNNENKYVSKCSDLGIFFDFMDNINTDNEIEEGDFYEDEESITINFYDKEKEKKLEEEIKKYENGAVHEIKLYDEACFTFTFYVNGCFSMTEIDNGVIRTTYHCLTYDEMLFSDFPRKMISEEALEDINAVSKEEMEEFLDSGFANREDDRAFFYPADQNYNIEYSVKNKAEFKDELLKFEWERADEYPISATDCWLLGFIISNDGYMKRLDGKNFKIYKLKNMSDLESFRNVIASHLVLNEFGTYPVSKEDILSAFAETYKGGEAKFRLDSEQFTGDTKCIVTDIDSLKKELSELEWVTCKSNEKDIYRDFYVAGALISRNGYIYPQSGGTTMCAYKLKDESDIGKLCEILDKYIEMQNE